MSEVPHPDVDWNAFLAYAKQANDATPKTWCSVENTEQSWIRMSALTRRYGSTQGSSKCILM
eukprot:gene4674-9265_t